MRLEPAKCINCGSVLDVDPTLEKATCHYCGTTYLVQDAIKHYRTSIEYFYANTVYLSGGSSAQSQLEAAEAFMKLKKYNDALETFEEVCKIAPQNYLGWWGQLRALTENFSKNLKYRKELNRIRDVFEAAEVFMPRDQKETLTAQYNAYYAPLEEAYRSQCDKLNKKISGCSKGIQNAEQEINRLNRISYSKYEYPWIFLLLIPLIVVIYLGCADAVTGTGIMLAAAIPAAILGAICIGIYQHNQTQDANKKANNSAKWKHKESIKTFEKDKQEAEKELYFLMTH